MLLIRAIKLAQGSEICLGHNGLRKMKRQTPPSRPASASRVPAKPQFFWALRPEDVPDNMRELRGLKGSHAPAYAHDPTSWLIHRPRVQFVKTKESMRRESKDHCRSESQFFFEMSIPRPSLGNFNSKPGETSETSSHLLRNRNSGIEMDTYVLLPLKQTSGAEPAAPWKELGSQRKDRVH